MSSLIPGVLSPDVTISETPSATLAPPNGRAKGNSARVARRWQTRGKRTRTSLTRTTGEISVAPEGNRQMFYLAAKRLIDVIGAVLVLIVLSPIMLLTLLVLTVTTRGRPIFVQQRIGYCGRPFRLYKFRTMVIDASARQHLIENEAEGPVFKNSRDPRITYLGCWLRCLSIDETPQLLHVLTGQMSLVGPRPPVGDEVLQYEPWQAKRLSVKPGLTCLWQVSGRSDIGFEQWMKMDLWYVRNQSLWTDFKLLLKTPASVLSTRGAY